VPALAALAAEPLYSIVDTALVGHLGADELGGVAVGTAAFTASFWLFSFLAFGVTPKVARALGAGDTEGAADVGMQALLIAAAAGTAVALLGASLRGPIVSLLGGEGRVAALGETYLGIRMLSAPFVLVALAGNGWLRGAQNTRTPMKIALVSAAANAVLAYLLIYPVGWGVGGAAIATLTCQAGAAAAFLVVLRPALRGTRPRVNKDVALSLLKVGADLVVRTGSLLAALTLATALATRMGTISVAAWQIAMQVFLLLSLSMDALAIVGQSLIARHLGAGDPAAAEGLARRLLELSVVAGALLALALFAARGGVARVFTDDAVVITTASLLLGWLALAQPLGALVFTLDGILIGALQTRFLAYAMLASSLLFAGVSLFAYNAGWGLRGLAAAMGLWLVARVVTTGWLYLSRRWARPPELTATFLEPVDL